MDDPDLWGVALGTIGGLLASLTSSHKMPVIPPPPCTPRPMVTTKVSPDIATCPLVAKSLLAENY